MFTGDWPPPGRSKAGSPECCIVEGVVVALAVDSIVHGVG